VCTALAAIVALGLLPAAGFWTLLMISALHAAALAPITTLADALALAAAGPVAGTTTFEYGWARGTGSAAFIAGTLVSGQVVSAWGLPSIVVSHAVLLSAAACAAMLVPEHARPERVPHSRGQSGRLKTGTKGVDFGSRLPPTPQNSPRSRSVGSASATKPNFHTPFD
jgi:MFS family permease